MDGWRCPGCGACWAPGVERCRECGPKKAAAGHERRYQPAGPAAETPISIPSCWPVDERTFAQRNVEDAFRKALQEQGWPTEAQRKQLEGINKQLREQQDKAYERMVEMNKTRCGRCQMPASACGCTGAAPC